MVPWFIIWGSGITVSNSLKSADQTCCNPKIYVFFCRRPMLKRKRCKTGQFDWFSERWPRLWFLGAWYAVPVSRYLTYRKPLFRHTVTKVFLFFFFLRYQLCLENVIKTINLIDPRRDGKKYGFQVHNMMFRNHSIKFAAKCWSDMP